MLLFNRDGRTVKKVPKDTWPPAQNGGLSWVRAAQMRSREVGCDKSRRAVYRTSQPQMETI